jgi:hypothetical protein
VPTCGLTTGMGGARALRLGERKVALLCVDKGRQHRIDILAVEAEDACDDPLRNADELAPRRGLSALDKAEQSIASMLRLADAAERDVVGTAHARNQRGPSSRRASSF